MSVIVSSVCTQIRSCIGTGKSPPERAGKYDCTSCFSNSSVSMSCILHVAASLNAHTLLNMHRALYSPKSFVIPFCSAYSLQVKIVYDEDFRIDIE